MAILGASARARLREQDSGWAWKTGLRLAMLVFNVVAIIILGVAAGEADKGVWPLFLPIIVSFIYLLISTSITIFGRKIIHPGFNVGADLVLWLAFLFLSLVVLYVTWLYAAASSYYINNGGIDNSGTSTDLGDSDTVDDGSSPGDGQQCPGFDSCDDALKYVDKVMNVSYAGTAFGFLLAALHFIMFIEACIRTHKYNAHMHASHTTSYQNLEGQQGYPLQSFPQQQAYPPAYNLSVPPVGQRASSPGVEVRNVVPEKNMNQQYYGHA